MSELWFKNEKVLTIRDIDGVPARVEKIDSPELLPFYLRNNCSDESFNKWLRKRSIPENREGRKEMIEEFGESWTSQKGTNYASLTDQYWIKKRTETWRRINFFMNRYSTELGDMAFNPWEVTVRRYNNNSPDITTGGILKKRWAQNSDKTSFLIKAGSEMTKQDPLSEVMVSVLCEKTGIVKSAGYDLCIEGTLMCSKTQNFITENTELVTAADFYYDLEKKPEDSVYDHLIRSCDKLEIPGAKEFLDGMIAIDRITANGDRNLNNIGFIKNSGTNKFIGPAPLYDCGNAYWSMGDINNTVISNLFGDTEQNIFNKIKSTFDLSFLEKDEIFTRLIESYPGMSDSKKKSLIEAIKLRNKSLCKGHSEIEQIR